MPPAMRTATSVRSGRNPHASGASRPVFHAKQFLRQSLFLVHPDGNVFRKHLDRVVNIEEVLGAVFIHAVFMNEDSLCEKTGGVRDLYFPLRQEWISVLDVAKQLRRNTAYFLRCLALPPAAVFPSY